MYKLSVSKDIFEDILLKRVDFIEKKATSYWKKEFFEAKIVEDIIVYDIKNIEKLLISNGLGEDKPQIVVECLKIDYEKTTSCFKIFLGKILEQKNVDDFKDEKDILIDKLLDEKNELLKILQEIKKSMK